MNFCSAKILRRGGKPQERLMQKSCLQGQGTGPDHSEISPTSLSATEDREEYTAERLSEEGGGYLESRWTQCPAQAAGRGVMWKRIWNKGRYVHLGQSFPIWLQMSTTLNRDSKWMGLRWDSSVLPKVRWPVWTHHLAPPVAMKRDKCPQRVAHPMVRYPSPLAAVSQDPTLDSCPRWSGSHSQRNSESRTYFLLHPETTAYFLRWYSTELYYMRVPCLVRRQWENKGGSNPIKSWHSVHLQEKDC